jgi:2-desacetyl-2-hydroxyethyl bacteriochlorophyllide A dehydrogenase
MKALVYEGPRVMNIRDVAEPAPGPGEALIQVAFSGICGSELSGYLGQNSLRRPPLIMGHEFAGTVIALGEQAALHNPDLALGQRVTVNPLSWCGRCRYCLGGRQQLCPRRQLLGAHRPGSYAALVAAPAANVLVLPDGISMEHATLTEPLACALRAVQLAGCSALDRALVIGLGPIGLLTLQVLKASGVEIVGATDTDPDRRAMAGHFGVPALDPLADDVAAHVRAATGELGADVVFDAVGSDATRRQAIDLVAPAGRVVLIGLHAEESPIPINALIRREVSLLGSFAYTPNIFAEALSWLAAGRITIDPWLVKAPLAEGGSCFERLLGRPGPVAKILLH